MTDWDSVCNDTFEGRLTGNAQHARDCRDTPLEADAILDLVVSNLGYYGDPYYRPITDPVDWRVAEYYASIGKAQP